MAYFSKKRKCDLFSIYFLQMPYAIRVKDFSCADKESGKILVEV